MREHPCCQFMPPTATRRMRIACWTVSRTLRTELMCLEGRAKSSSWLHWLVGCRRKMLLLVSRAAAPYKMMILLNAGPSTSGLIRMSRRPCSRSGCTTQRARGQRSAANTSAMRHNAYADRLIVVSPDLARATVLR